ncbi:MAG: J domain-containing protein [Sphingobacteriales bacterium]|nr:MAG: J domain-containing protein [Sphingobacteriales bacterium]
MLNYYEILGISRDATEEELKRAYRKQVLKWHPDRNPGDKHAAAFFLQVQEAYEQLSDFIKRSNYNDFLEGKELETEAQADPVYQSPFQPGSEAPRNFQSVPVTPKRRYPKGTVPFAMMIVVLIGFVIYLYASKPEVEYIKAPITPMVTLPVINNDTSDRALDRQFRESFRENELGVLRKSPDTLIIHDSVSTSLIEELPAESW